MALKYRLLFFLICFSLGCFAQSINLDKEIIVDNQKRHFLIHLPTGFEVMARLPVVLALHGSGGDSKIASRHYNMNGLADANGFIVVYPNAINGLWNLNWSKYHNRGLANDYTFISTLLDELSSHYKADSNRIFCTGISRGGVFSLLLAWQLCGRIRAIAPVCASIPNGIKNEWTFAHALPVLLINGTEDPLINYRGGAGKVSVPYSGGQPINMMATEELVQKILALNNCQSKPIVKNLADNDPKDGCVATDYKYNCRGVAMEFIKITGGGHSWPGGYQYEPRSVIGNLCKDFSASEKIFEFFKGIKYQ